MMWNSVIISVVVFNNNVWWWNVSHDVSSVRSIVEGNITLTLLSIV